MMGDREKCIQAQMDEYLSKPLQQNHLIQTILKCATLGGQLLEKNRERELTRAADAATGGRHDTGSLTQFQNVSTLLRPPLAARSATTANSARDDTANPAIASDDPQGRLPRTNTSLSEPSIRAPS